MNAEKIYEKAEKRLTISGKCGTIFKQSAQTASHLRCPWGCANRICEGGGTGRRARLRCVWFILGGSNPLLRTIKKTRMNAENSVSMRVFFVLFACRYSQIVTVICGFCTPKVVKIWSLTSAARDRLPVLHDLAGHSMLVRQKGGAEVCVKVRGVGIRGSHSAA